ncbi:hypothetical protein [Streptomyces hydrogenans]|uniref:Holin n=1 Tax=Streptomyces hydrogenans TaxID=1873719 RepID=A0ABQ3PMK0_9ACTN|nr:hypothetical protein [Streptomyces hydrogenans]GHE31936.1 hypothetical protein GCM10018784_80600 [Streptomyces hydrogenans]GHI26227.1 hypothetical protein Shyd_75980 [Streptomyces hydrogenans]
MKDSTRRTVRTVFQTVVSVAAGMPLLLDASDIPETAPGVGVIIAVAAAVTRLMALPLVDGLLPSFLKKDAAV